MMKLAALRFGAFILAATCNCAAGSPDNRGQTTGAEPSQAAPSVMPRDTVVIDNAVCRRLIEHHPASDTAYQPGVDVYGREVAPADLEGAPRLQMPETITVELTPELRQWLPNPDPPYDKLEGARINLGIIQLAGDMVTFNGQPLGREAEENLAVLCLGVIR